MEGMCELVQEQPACAPRATSGQVIGHAAHLHTTRLGSPQAVAGQPVLAGAGVVAEVTASDLHSIAEQSSRVNQQHNTTQQRGEERGEEVKRQGEVRKEKGGEGVTLREGEVP